MQIEEKIFSRRTPNFSRLLENGFTLCPAGYTFSKDFGESKYRADITISASGNVSGTVTELESGDEFLPLRVSALTNETVQYVRAEYSEILCQIAKSCFTPLFFLNPQSNRIASLICTQYGDQPDFPWKGSPSCGVFRHQNTRKWYGVIMNITPEKLYVKDPLQRFRLPDSIAIKQEIEIMDLKIAASKVPTIITQSGIFPGYHLNDKYWITILLEDILPDEIIMKLVLESYNATQ